MTNQSKYQDKCEQALRFKNLYRCCLRLVSHSWLAFPLKRDNIPELIIVHARNFLIFTLSN